MMQILYKLQIVNNKFTLSLYTESMKTLFFMLIITFLIKPFQLSTVYLVLFLYFLAKKDYETMYIEKYWIFLFVSGIIKLIKSDWIGSADVCYLTFFGLYLGIERMLVALYISILLGFLWILYKKKHILPYVSCLCIGVWIAVLKGYTIFHFLINLFS